MRRQKAIGFSLIELLIVVAIILIIAAIAIPSFLRAKISANEASAVSSVHAVNTAEISYITIFPTVGYAAALTNLGPGGACNVPANACIIDSSLASGLKGGYSFTYTQIAGGPPAPGYTLNADPITRGVTGQRSFYSDQSNVTRFNQSAAAGPADLALQ